MTGEPDRSPAPVLLVDAANVVGSRPTGWWRDRPGAARQLCTEVAEALVTGRLDPPVVVVLEGRARLGAPTELPPGMLVVTTQGSGDDALVGLTRLIRQRGLVGPLAQLEAGPATSGESPTDGPAPRAVVCVSADRALADRILALGGQVVGPSWLWARLSARTLAQVQGGPATRTARPGH